MLRLASIWVFVLVLPLLLRTLIADKCSTLAFVLQFLPLPMGLTICCLTTRVRSDRREPSWAGLYVFGGETECLLAVLVCLVSPPLFLSLSLVQDRLNAPPASVEGDMVLSSWADARMLITTAAYIGAASGFLGVASSRDFRT